MSKLRTRRKRRQSRAKLRNRKAAPRHRLKTGRTGGVHYKKTPSSKKSGYVSVNITAVFRVPQWWGVRAAREINKGEGL